MNISQFHIVCFTITIIITYENTFFYVGNNVISIRFSYVSLSEGEKVIYFGIRISNLLRKKMLSLQHGIFFFLEVIQFTFMICQVKIGV